MAHKRNRKSGGKQKMEKQDEVKEKTMTEKKEVTEQQAVKQQKVGVKNSIPGVDEMVGIVSVPLADAAERGDFSLITGIENIATLPVFDPKNGLPRPIPGTGTMVPGRMAFRRLHKGMFLAVAGGKAPLFYLPLDKLILMVERLHDEKRRTVIVQNCSEDKDSEHSKGQVLARINPQHSALNVIWGRPGMVISDPGDIVKSGVYYINRVDLLFFYLAATSQLKGGDELESLLRANEGWREYDLPTNPLDPGAE